MPCRLHWNNVVLILEKAGKDFEAFKKSVAEFIFDLSHGVPACDWLEEWLALEQIPALDDSPLINLKLDRKQKESVRFYAKVIAEKKVGQDDPVACSHLINNLIRLGCWQTASRSSSGVESTIDDIKKVLFSAEVTEECLTEAEEMQSLA